MPTNRHSHNSVDEAEHKRVSVIIPTLNAGENFSILLDKLQSQTYKPYEIIVIDSESSDATVTIAQQKHAVVLHVKRSDFDHGGTRNLAAAYAQGNILLFLTQDIIPYDDRLIEKLLAPFQLDDDSEGAIAYSYARQLVDDSGHILEKTAREVNYPSTSFTKDYHDIDKLGIKTFFCSNACSAIRKDMFEKQGGFISPTIFNEDMFMAARLVLSGKAIAYCAEAIVYHTHHYTLMQQFKRYFDNGLSMRTQPWILPYAKAVKAGTGLVKKQFIDLVKAYKLHLVPYLVLEAAAKYTGYKLGLSAHRLPKRVVRKLTMHTLIFEKLLKENKIKENNQSKAI